ncbi:MAG: trypsin-like peptidase domain-containing protein, partial [Phycisphaerae bacterium]
TDPASQPAAWPESATVSWAPLGKTAIGRTKRAVGYPAGVPLQVGLHRDVPGGVLSCDTDGAWSRLDGSKRVWTLALRAPGARGLRIHFSRFELPAGSRLMIGGESGQRPLTYYGRGPHSGTSFWSELLEGAAAFIEYQDPTGRGPAPAIEIDRIAHIYAGDLFSAGHNAIASPQLLPCQEDVNCHPVDPTARDAVGRIVFSRPGEGTFVCSGVLLNDADPNTFAGYFLTANHCLDTQAMVDSAQVLWFFERRTCGGKVTAGPTSLGGTLLATSPSTDFTLFRLADDPADGQGFAAWTTEAPLGTVRGIHHPGGGEKKFSEGFITNAGPSCASCCDKPVWRYIYNDWTIGATEGGSSGSPLFNENWEVIGQLFGTCAYVGITPACNNPQDYNNVYGRFAATFPSISDFLNTITPDDPFEDNDLPSRAAVLDTGVHALRLVDFDDYFQIRVCQPDVITVTADFASAEMGLSLALLDGGGSTLATSSRSGPSTNISIPVPPGDYVVHVGKETGWGGDYTLSITLAGATDCNGNGLRDACELLDGLVSDCNADAVPDVCRPGDLNGDATVDAQDHAGFAGCLTGPCASATCAVSTSAPTCCPIADFDGDGTVDLRDAAAFQRAFGAP